MAAQKSTLTRWGLSVIDAMQDEALFEEFASHQSSAEQKIGQAMMAMQY